MYGIFESVINKGGWKLGEMLERIRTYAAGGRLTMNEMDALEKMAREKASMQDGTDVLGMLLDHEARLRALEVKNASAGDAVTGEYVSGKWYYGGDTVMWMGEAYVCTAPEGVICVWDPQEYPAYWQKMN